MEERGKNPRKPQGEPLPQSVREVLSAGLGEKHGAKVTPTPPPGAPGCHVEWGRNVPVKRVSEETFLP